MKILGNPKTVGELRALLNNYSAETYFNFRNQPAQQLVECNGIVCFQEEPPCRMLGKVMECVGVRSTMHVVNLREMLLAFAMKDIKEPISNFNREGFEKIVDRFLKSQKLFTTDVNGWLSVEQAAKLYGQKVKCKWLSPCGNDWLNKEITVNADFLREMEKGSIKEAYR